MSKWVQLLVVSLAVPTSLAHCVGDESSLDGGADGAVDVVGTSDAASLDALSSDASDGSDAPAAACDLSKPFDAPAAFDVVNSDEDEGSFRLSADGTRAYFARGSQASSSFQVYVATKAGAFADGAPLAGVNAASGITADATVTADELEIFFETTDTSGDAGAGYFHVWRASRTQTSMDFASRAPLSVLVGVNAGAPYLSADGNTLYFQSYDDGTIKASTRVSGAQFAPPTVQVSGGAPVVTNDGLTMYLRNNDDIWVSHRANTTANWDIATSVTELNSSSTDLPSFVTADGCTIYFTSDRTGVKKGLNVWVATKPSL